MIYPSFIANLFAAKIDLLADPIKALLVTAAYKPAKSHATLADVTGEVEGKGYVAGGQALEGKKLKDGRFTAEPLLWANATIRGAIRVVLYRAGRKDPLICCFDLPEEANSTNGPFRVPWGSDGIFELVIENGQ